MTKPNAFRNQLARQNRAALAWVVEGATLAMYSGEIVKVLAVRATKVLVSGANGTRLVHISSLRQETK